jgi:hypothetical protein
MKHWGNKLIFSFFIVSYVLIGLWFGYVGSSFIYTTYNGHYCDPDTSDKFLALFMGSLVFAFWPGFIAFIPTMDFMIRIFDKNLAKNSETLVQEFSRDYKIRRNHEFGYQIKLMEIINGKANS